MGQSVQDFQASSRKRFLIEKYIDNVVLVELFQCRLHFEVTVSS